MKLTWIGFLLGCLIAFGACAQGQSSAAPTAFTDNELKAFVSAAAEIQRINADFEGRVRAAASEQEQRELVLAASIQQNAAVSSRGITADRYQQIIERIDSDPVFAERIAAQLKAQIK
jgi:parvulin-like peptidyl-prolyl isomerase